MVVISSNQLGESNVHPFKASIRQLCEQKWHFIADLSAPSSSKKILKHLKHEEAFFLFQKPKVHSIS